MAFVASVAVVAKKLMAEILACLIIVRDRIQEKAFRLVELVKMLRTWTGKI